MHDGTADAATTPRCARVRDRIGAEIHRRIRSAIGPDADPRTVSALEMTFFGALVQRGQRRLHLPPDRRPTQLRRRPHPRRGPMMTGNRTRQRRAPRPVRLRLPRGSVPVLQAAARRGSAVPQRGARVLGAVAAQRRAAGVPQQHHAVQPRRRVARPDLARAARAARRCRSSRWTTPPTCGCAHWCRRGSRRGGSASSSPASPRSPCSTSTRCWRRPTPEPSTTSTNSRASCRWTSSPS